MEDHMKVSKIITLVAPLALALAAAPASAHGFGGGGACRPLLQQLCPSVTPGPGPGGYGSCLKALCGTEPTSGPGGFASCLLKQSAISNFPNCQAELTNMQAKIAAWQATFNTACATATGTTPSDVSTYCANVTGGMGSQVQCLRQAVTNNQPVSQPCQAFLAEQHGHRHHGYSGHL
jgi:hypothetical protein